MKVMSLWTRRTSKIFLPAEAELLVPVALLLQVVALVVLLAELAGVPAVLDVAEQLDAELVRVEPAARAWPSCRSGGRRSRCTSDGCRAFSVMMVRVPVAVVVDEALGGVAVRRPRRRCRRRRPGRARSATTSSSHVSSLNHWWLVDVRARSASCLRSRPKPISLAGTRRPTGPCVWTCQQPSLCGRRVERMPKLSRSSWTALPISIAGRREDDALPCRRSRRSRSRRGGTRRRRASASAGCTSGTVFSRAQTPVFRPRWTRKSWTSCERRRRSATSSRPTSSAAVTPNTSSTSAAKASACSSSPVVRPMARLLSLMCPSPIR